ncbi:hypothetical protein [Bacillus smithii]|uniref:hypothetical protein n=1 Tax=Bacillus smithii TaxID=1479 RepID=UPI003D1BF3B6
MTTIMTKKEAVELFGSDDQKRHFAKYGKFKNKNLENALIKTLEQYHESVEIIKQGRAFVYELGEKRTEIAEREDKRKFNGEGQLPENYEQGFPIMILEYLMGNNVSQPKTTTNLLYEMGFITKEMYEASKSKYSQSVLYSEIDKLKKKDIIEEKTESIVYDYIDREIIRLTNHFMGYIKKLEDAKLIIHNKHTIGQVVAFKNKDRYSDKLNRMVTEVEEATEYIELTPFVVEKIARMRRELQNRPEFKHLTSTDIYRYRNKKDVQEYWKEHNELLYAITDENGQQLRLLMTFEAHTIFLQAGDNPIKRWLEKKANRGAIDLYNSDEVQYYLQNREKFHKSRDKYVVELAQRRQDKAQKDNNGLVDELGGKGKQVVINFDDTDWIKNQKLMYLGLYVEAYERLQNHYGFKFN